MDSPVALRRPPRPPVAALAQDCMNQSLADVLPQPFVVIDRSLRVVLANRAFEVAYGISRDAVVGHPCHQLLHPAGPRPFESSRPGSCLLPGLPPPCGAQTVACPRPFQSQTVACPRPFQSQTVACPRPFPCGPSGRDCPFGPVFAGERDLVAVDTCRDEDGEERLVRIQGYALRSASGEVLLGELIHDPQGSGSPGKRQEPGRDDPQGSGSPGKRQEPGRELDAETPAPAGHRANGPRMVGESGRFRQVLGQLRLAARTDAPVLLEGATGTGKELAAGYIHRHSARRLGPLVTLDCTTLSPDLFESEVFGHERGAFTGSRGKRQGLVELAHGGTLFLDEIGEMPLPLQAKLLRVLESGEYRRVGAGATRRADVRIVCATNRDLRDARGFRQDLYFRIACVRVRMPTLAERTEDIPLLAEELLERIGSSAGRSFRLEPQALTLLQAHLFPGNVRELRNVLWVAAVHSDDGRIPARQIALALEVEPAVSGAVPARPPPAPAALTLHDVETLHLRDLLATHAGNRRAVAAALQVSERTLYRKLRRHELS